MRIHKIILIIILFVFCFLTGKNLIVHGEYSIIPAANGHEVIGKGSPYHNHFPLFPAAQSESINSKEITNLNTGFSEEEVKFGRKQHTSVQVLCNTASHIIHQLYPYDSMLLHDIQLLIHLRL